MAKLPRFEPATKLARPTLTTDRAKIVRAVQGKIIPDSKIPACFSDPHLDSGVCNPHLPLRHGEKIQCALVKSCLAAKLCAAGLVDIQTAMDSTYDALLAHGDSLFDQQQVPPGDEFTDRQKLRGHVVSMPVVPPVNPYRKNSLRRAVLDLLIHDWMTVTEIRSHLIKNASAQRIDTAIAQVTSLVAQESHNYRVVESLGKYKAFRRI